MLRRHRRSLIIAVSILVILIIGGIVLQLSGVFAPQKIYGLSGIITKMDNEKIVIDAMIPQKNGIAKNTTKTIIVDQNTKITTIKIPVGLKVISGQPIELTETEIKISDLNINDKIDIIVDPSNQKNLLAKTIKLVQ